MGLMVDLLGSLFLLMTAHLCPLCLLCLARGDWILTIPRGLCK